MKFSILFGRSKLVKGVSLLGVVAVIGLGISELGSNGQPEEMRSKTDLELEGLSDPLFEELFEDKYHRALEEYNGSKGLFFCNEACQVHKRRLSIVGRELNAIQQERAAARKAALARARDIRLAAAAARKAEAAERSAFAHLANEDRIAVRKATRKAERDAERAAAIAAHRLQLGAPAAPLTLAEKQARAAAAKEARITNRRARISPEQRNADAQANRDALWFEYLDEVAMAHGFANWESVEEYLVMTPEERTNLVQGNWEDGMWRARLNVRHAVRQAANRTPAPTPAPTSAPTPAPTPAPTTAPTPEYAGPYIFLDAGQYNQCPAGHEVGEFECTDALDGLYPWKWGTWSGHSQWQVTGSKAGLPCGCTFWKRQTPTYYSDCSSAVTHANTEIVCRKEALDYVPVKGNFQHWNGEPVGNFFTYEISHWENIFGTPVVTAGQAAKQNIAATTCSSDGFQKQTFIWAWSQSSTTPGHWMTWVDTGDRFKNQVGKETSSAYQGPIFQHPDMRIYKGHVSCAERMSAI